MSTTQLLLGNCLELIIPLDHLWSDYRRATKANAGMVFTAAQPFTSTLALSNVRQFRYALVWDKSQVTGFLNARRQPLRSHENVLVFYNDPPTYVPFRVHTIYDIP